MTYSYQVGKYKGKWAVFASPSCVWYFPRKAGKRNAEKLAESLAE